MIERLKQRLQPKAAQQVASLVDDLYVREEALEVALKTALKESIDELHRVLADRFDAEAEVNSIIGQRVAALVAAVEALRDEVQVLRSELAAQRMHTIDGDTGEDRPERTWSHGG